MTLTEALDEFYRKQNAPAESAPDGCSLVSFRPVASDALKVHPSQVNEAREEAKRRGVNVEFRNDGTPVFTSSRQFRDYCRKHGYRHRGY